MVPHNHRQSAQHDGALLLKQDTSESHVARRTHRRNLSLAIHKHKHRHIAECTIQSMAKSGMLYRQAVDPGCWLTVKA